VELKLSDAEICVWWSMKPKSSNQNFKSCYRPYYLTAGFDLPRHTWFLMNRFWTGQGPCYPNLHKWGLAQSPSCDCGQRQTMNHIVDTCPKFEGGLNLLHEVDDDVVIWLESTATAALTK